jgi:hypothetical protein
MVQVELDTLVKVMRRPYWFAVCTPRPAARCSWLGWHPAGVPVLAVVLVPVLVLVAVVGLVDVVVVVGAAVAG